MTYNLKGDGSLALIFYEVVSTLAAGIHMQLYTIQAVAQKLHGKTLPLSSSG